MTDGWVGSAEFVIPDSIEPIIGWRSWVVRRFQVGDEPGDPVLTSVLSPVWWPKHEAITARHVREYDDPIAQKRAQLGIAHPGGVPSEQCHCGVYAWKKRQSLVEDGQWAPGISRVSGRVRMWGHVIVHARGYRAQFARVDAIIGDERMAGLTYELAEAYGVPLL
jgi:hypothetical protein